MAAGPASGPTSCGFAKPCPRPADQLASVYSQAA